MQKVLKILLLVGTLSVFLESEIFAQAEYNEGPWSFVTPGDVKNGTSVCSTNLSKSFNGLNGYSWAGGPSFVQNNTDGTGVSVKGTTGSNQNYGVFIVYSHSKTVSAYTKSVLNNTICVKGFSTGIWHTVAAYKFDTYDQVTTTAVDFTYNMGNGSASAKRLAYAYAQGKAVASGNVSTTYTFDNSKGSQDASISKYLLFTDVFGQSNSSGSSMDCSGYLKSVSYSWTDYYYKYFTFDANGGSGSMSVQTIENNGNLTNNSFTRQGYTFAGWNTAADGSGTAYSNGQAVTATSSDKGEITLFAQWEKIDVQVSSSGYSTVYSDKKLLVPSGVKVYGFTYSNGTLVQGAEISEGVILQAGQGYLIKAAEGTYSFFTSTSAATAPASDLTGSITEINTPSGDVYVWGKPSGYEYGWYKYTGAKISAGKAYYLKF